MMWFCVLRRRCIFRVSNVYVSLFFFWYVNWVEFAILCLTACLLYCRSTHKMGTWTTFTNQILCIIFMWMTRAHSHTRMKAQTAAALFSDEKLIVCLCTRQNYLLLLPVSCCCRSWCLLYHHCHSASTFFVYGRMNRVI